MPTIPVWLTVGKQFFRGKSASRLFTIFKIDQETGRIYYESHDDLQREISLHEFLRDVQQKSIYVASAKNLPLVPKILRQYVAKSS